MAKMKSLEIAMAEELQDMENKLDELDMELGFLEHEWYSISNRIQRKREQMEDLKWEISQHKEEMREVLDVS